MESAVQAVFVSDEYSVHATTNRSQSSHFRSSSSFLVVANEGHANLREKGARVSGFRDRGGSIIYSTSSRAASRWVTCTFRDVVKKETRRGSNARKKRGRTTRENDVLALPLVPSFIILPWFRINGIDSVEGNRHRVENRWVGFFFLENTVEAITSVYAGTTFSLLSSEGGSASP